MNFIKTTDPTVLHGIIGGITCFIGPDHHALTKACIGVVLGFAIQHHYMLPESRKSSKPVMNCLKRFLMTRDKIS